MYVRVCVWNRGAANIRYSASFGTVKQCKHRLVGVTVVVAVVL